MPIMNTLIIIPSIFGVSLKVYLILIILAIAIFHIWRWIFKKFIKNTNIQKSAIWFATLITTPLVYYFSVILLFSILCYYPSNKFEKEKWIMDKEHRYELSDDIIENKLLIGKSKLQVIEIVGLDSNCEENDLLNYYIGFASCLGIDTSVLQITFKDGKVVEVIQYEG